MKLKQSFFKFITNKWVLNIISFLSLFNLIGYLMIGKIEIVLLFIVIAILVKYFSKNMVLILGIPLILVNLYSLGKNSQREGMETNDNTTTQTQQTQTTHKEVLKNALNTKKNNDGNVIVPPHNDNISNYNDNDTTNNDTTSSDTNNDTIDGEKAGFEVGRRKNGSSKIDYATTIEDAYDQLNSILGSDGVKSLTNDTQKLMQQQMELAKSMQSMAPLIKNIMPMAEKAQEMMRNMDSGSSGLGNVMEIAKKMSGGLMGSK